ncbi:maturation protein, partial [ssRNA phage Gerhypos.4_19]
SPSLWTSVMVFSDKAVNCRLALKLCLQIEQLVWRYSFVEPHERTRLRLTPVDPSVNGGGTWNSAIRLGGFRSLLTGIDGGVPYSKWADNFYQEVYYSPDVSLCQGEITVDELHGRPPYRSGGPYLNVKVQTSLPKAGKVEDSVYYDVSGTHRYEGGFCPPALSWWGSGWAATPLAFLTRNSNALLPDVAPYFDAAWLKAKPKLEFASLYVFLKEAEDIPRSLFTTSRFFHDSWLKLGGEGGPKVMTPKRIADQFINQQFGWAPFLSDVKSFGDIYFKAQQIFDKIRRENGRGVRQHVEVYKDEDVSDIVPYTVLSGPDSFAIPCFPVAFPGSFFLRSPAYRVYETNSLSIHASGKFSYYRPEFDDSLGEYNSFWNEFLRYITVSGLRPTPSNIYKAIPWTWLADWVSSLGARIQRLSDEALDSVVAQYFYITALRKVTRTMEVELPFAEGFKRFKFEVSYQSKQRVSADNPYGFRLSWSDLSPRQLTILAALGISKKT